MLYPPNNTSLSTSSLQRLPVTFASNDAGVLMLGVALYSLLSSAESGTHYVIYILDDEISPANRAKLHALQDTHDCEVHFLPVHERLRELGCKEHRDWPATMYARLFLPTLLPSEQRVLYLDIDVLVMRDLGELLHARLGGALLGAVYEGLYTKFSAHWRRIGVPEGYGYFNSGVLLMDLEAMRAEQTEAALQSYLSTHASLLMFPDQDVFNAVLYHRVLALHPRWNWNAHQTRFLLRKRKLIWGNMGPLAAQEAAGWPAIIHFPGKNKPIFKRSYGYYDALYCRIWQQSPWKDVPRSGKAGLGSAMKRCLYRVADALIRRKISRLVSEK